MCVDGGMVDLMKPLTCLGHCVMQGSSSISIQWNLSRYCWLLALCLRSKNVHWKRPNSKSCSLFFNASITRLPIVTKPWQICLSCDSLLCRWCLCVPNYCSLCTIGYVWCSMYRRSTLPPHPLVSYSVLYEVSSIHHPWTLAPAPPLGPNWYLYIDGRSYGVSAACNCL